MSQITVYTAKTIHTMEPSHAFATAIAVRDGEIL
jgi:predicted amidohydrolase YtcJ